MEDLIFKDAFEPPTDGSVRIITVTSEFSLDPDGYTVRIGSNDYGLIMAANGTTLFTHILPGSQAVELGGLSANCSAADNPRTIAVTVGVTTDVQFDVTCVVPIGSLRSA